MLNFFEIMEMSSNVLFDMKVLSSLFKKNKIFPKPFKFDFIKRVATLLEFAHCNRANKNILHLPLCVFIMTTKSCTDRHRINAITGKKSNIS